MGPFDLPGPQFLMLYGILLVAAILFGLIIPRLLRPNGMDAPVTDEDELAYLAGGEARLAEAVVARLMASDAISVLSARNIPILQPAQSDTRAGRAVLSLPSPTNWRAITQAIQGEAEQIWHRLASRGLMMDSGEFARVRLLQTAPYLLLLAFGAIKLVIGMSRDRPVGFLVALLVVTAVGAMIRYGNVDRRTRAGVNAVIGARSDADRLRRAPGQQESGKAVALFGTAVLAGSALSQLHTMRASSSSSSSSGCSSDDGGCSSDSSGCSSDSGGGCGGCGGGD
ncbi:MAG: TIGR04222 domain-containing membrane protein [Novosphingobium sp.]